MIAFEDHLSGKRLLNVLGKRLGRYGLQLHPTKTRFVDFRFKRPGGRYPATAGTTFNFLGFTHVWGQSRKGKNVVRQITAKDRYARALASVTEWCRLNLHRPFREQHAHLSRVIRGHCAYYGISGNGRRIRWYHHQITRIWKKWLARRWPPQQSAVVALPGHARATPAADSQDRPPICRPVSEAYA
ncbi:reverse transcriptase domain-containing protein [Bradyrhizobium sp. USDA 4506]